MRKLSFFSPFFLGEKLHFSVAVEEGGGQQEQPWNTDEGMLAGEAGEAGQSQECSRGGEEGAASLGFLHAA